MTNVVELEVYQRSLDFSNRIWEICIKWNYFARDTIGKQLVRASDSVNANLAESRKLINEKELSNLKSELTIIAKQLNAYINSLKRKSTK